MKKEQIEPFEEGAEDIVVITKTPEKKRGGALSYAIKIVSSLSAITSVMLIIMLFI